MSLSTERAQVAPGRPQARTGADYGIRCLPMCADVRGFGHQNAAGAQSTGRGLPPDPRRVLPVPIRVELLEPCFRDHSRWDAEWVLG